MRIHANARTCPNSRRLLVRRIEDEGWALTPGGRGRRGERADREEVARAVAGRG